MPRTGYRCPARVGVIPNPRLHDVTYVGVVTLIVVVIVVVVIAQRIILGGTIACKLHLNTPNCQSRSS